MEEVMKKLLSIFLACFFYSASSYSMTLDFYHLWPKGGPSMVDEILWDATKQFEEENPGITLSLIHISEPTRPY